MSSPQIVCIVHIAPKIVHISSRCRPYIAISTLYTSSINCPYRRYIVHIVHVSILSFVHISSTRRPYILHISCRQYIVHISPISSRFVHVSSIYRPYLLYIVHRSSTCRPNIVHMSSANRPYIVCLVHRSPQCRQYIEKCRPCMVQISSSRRHISSMYQSETRKRDDPGGGWVGMMAPQRNRERAKRYVCGDDVVHVSSMY